VLLARDDAFKGWVNGKLHKLLIINAQSLPQLLKSIKEGLWIDNSGERAFDICFVLHLGYLSHFFNFVHSSLLHCLLHDVATTFIHALSINCLSNLQFLLLQELDHAMNIIFKGFELLFVL
jgi:hypothetical protein